jgi:sporadic carbohydrate cluster 2OG-Fe(II) oxygenase
MKLNSKNISQQKRIENEFLKEGYTINKIENTQDLKWIKDHYLKIICDVIKFKNKHELNKYDFFNNIHKFVKKTNLNDFRLKVINRINSSKKFKSLYYKICKPYLDILVGEELVMQNRINLSIQLPKDKGSLLHTHADTWDGNSPFEIVVWLPLVDCYKTKSMYILPYSQYKSFEKYYKKRKEKKLDIFNKFKKRFKWLKIDYGQILLFNQSLPHGNIMNKEKETRWSMNCRFKNPFTPYSEKKIGEFFSPIKLKPLSELGLKYKLPDEI